MTYYKDIDLSFEKNILNDINSIKNAKAIQQSIKNLIEPKLGAYTIFQNPQKGTNIGRLLGERASRFVGLQIEDEIRTVIENFEPRVNIIRLESTFGPDIGLYTLKLVYLIVASQQEDTLITELTVIR